MTQQHPEIINFADSPETTEVAESTGERDITKAWVAALDIQPNPDYILVEEGLTLDQYAEILTDDQVHSTFQQRRRAVTSREWEVSAGEEEHPEAERAADLLREDIKALDWDAITDKMLFATHYGYAVGEIMWAFYDGHWALDDIKVRNRARFEFNNAGELLLITTNNPGGEVLPQEKFWVHRVGHDHDDQPHGRGLGHNLYWPTFFKRQGMRFWLTMLDKFGMPTVMGVIAPSKIGDKTYVAKLLKTLRKIQTDSAVVTPEDVSIELLEAARGGRVDYDALQSRLNAAISKIVLSQTMTTDDGSSRSQGEVHKDVRDEVLKSDADQLSESFHRQVVRQWTDYNFGPLTPPPRVWRRTEDDEDLNEVAERDAKIKELGYEPTEDRMLEVYGEGYQKVEAPPALAGAGFGPASGFGPPGSPVPATPEEFAEALEFAGSMPSVAIRRLAHQNAQASMAVGAGGLAQQTDITLGRQVRRIMQTIEASEDLADFAERLPALAQDDPDPLTVETIKRATVFSRILGMVQQRRRKDDT